MQQLFALLSRSIAHDIRSINIRSSGFFRDAKSPELQPNLAQIFTKRTTINLPAAETLALTYHSCPKPKQRYGAIHYITSRTGMQRNS